MNESSSSIRSLLILGLYFRHTATIGDLLIIDEPELNLHPDNQRLLVRLLARLVNNGIKVFITTHSDYIIKELNILLSLKQDGKKFTHLKEKYRYDDDELLSASQIRAYNLDEEPGAEEIDRSEKKYMLKPARVSQEGGISMKSIDRHISNMNKIYDEIIWG